MNSRIAGPSDSTFVERTRRRTVAYHGRGGRRNSAAIDGVTNSILLSTVGVVGPRRRAIGDTAAAFRERFTWTYGQRGQESVELCAISESQQQRRSNGIYGGRELSRNLSVVAPRQVLDIDEEVLTSTDVDVATPPRSSEVEMNSSFRPDEAENWMCGLF
ncbi:hypothetical protein GQ600_3937 [Phytophthora cactorum]|nr:hypothetical protein GQ600_3937 [Phytophthora cactorum]